MVCVVVGFESLQLVLVYIVVAVEFETLQLLLLYIVVVEFETLQLVLVYIVVAVGLSLSLRAGPLYCVVDLQPSQYQVPT